MAQSGMSKINLRLFFFFLLAVTFVTSCDDSKTKAPKENPPTVTPPEPFKAIAPDFNADSAYVFIEKQLSFGPRIPNTPGHVACANWMVSQFKAFGAETMIQAAEITEKSGKRINMKNIVASYNPATREIIPLIFLSLLERL